MNKFLCVWLMLAALISAENAYAYVDPGTGSMMAQLMLAGVAGAGVAFRVWLRHLLTALRVRKRS